MQLNEQFLRMQKLAGITANDADIELANLLTEIHLHEHFYSKGILKENVNEGQINEIFSNILDKVKKLGKSGKEKLVGVLLGKLKALVGDNNYDKALALFKITNKEKFKEAAEELAKELEKNNIAEAAEKKVKYTKGFKNFFIALSILIFSTAGATNLADKVYNGEIKTISTATTDTSTDTVKDALKDAYKYTETNTNSETKSIEKGGEPQINSDEQNETNVELGTGDYTMSPAKTAEVIKTTADNMIKSIKAAQEGGNEITDVSFEVHGSINDKGVKTGDQDNPTGSDDSGLGEFRGNEAEKIAKGAVAKVKKETGITVNVEKGKVIDNKNKAGFKIKNEIKSKKSEKPEPKKDVKTDTAPDAEGFLKNPKTSVDPINNVYTIILNYILPLLITDESYKTNVQSKLTTKAFPKGINDRSVNDYIVKFPKEEEAIKMLKWARSVTKSPSTLLKNFGDLDPKLKNTLERIKKYQGRPGSKASQTPAPGPGASGDTSGDISGVSKTSLGENISLLEMYNELLLEVQTDFNELTGYDGARARNNLGILVPIFTSIWHTNNPNADKEDSSIIDYIAQTYKDSYRKFETNYPVFLEKVKKWKEKPGNKPDEKATQEKGKETDATQSGEKPVGPAKTNAKVDAKTGKPAKTDAKVAGTATSADLKSKNPEQADSNKTGELIDKNPALKAKLKVIKTTDQLGDLVFGIITLFSNKALKSFPKQKNMFSTLYNRVNNEFPTASRLKQAFAKAKDKFNNTYPNDATYKEETQDQDPTAIKTAQTDASKKEKSFTQDTTVLGAFTVFNSNSALTAAIQKNNTEEEVYQLILRYLIPYLGPYFYSQKDDSEGTYNRGTGGQFAQKTLRETPLNEQFLRMQKLAGLITEGQYQARKKALNEGKYSDWWAKADDELGLDFGDDIYSYVDSYDEPWQGKFANEVVNIDADNYEDFKNQVKQLYDEINPF